MTRRGTPESKPYREVHLRCGGTVVLRHEEWQCLKCKRRPISVLDTKTIHEELTEP